MKASEILDGAATIIETNGWYQGHFYDEEKYGPFTKFARPFWQVILNEGAPCCAEGALYAAAPNNVTSINSARLRLENLVLGDRWQGSRDIPSWNDAEERTKEEVLAKLREAAAIARGEGK